MRIGQLNHRLTITQRQPGHDAAGQPYDDWVTVCECWADVRGLAGLESIKADAVAATTKVSARIRWRTGLTTAMHAQLEDGAVYNITAVLPDHQGREHVDLNLERVE